MFAAAVADLALVALVVALSPFPLVASIVAAGAANPATGPAFAAGWASGLGILTTVLVVVTGEIDPANVTPDAWAQILVGAALLFAALRKWRTRPSGEAPPKSPGWMASLDGGTARAFGIGAALGGANPKNLALAAAGAAILHYHGLFGARAALAVLAFVAIGSSTVIGIVLAGAFGNPRITAALDKLKAFMLRHNNLILLVLFAAIGAKLLWNGLSALLT